jgi:hypothetical protein
MLAAAALGRVHNNEQGDGREHCAAVGELEGEARGIVVIGLDGLELEIEETLQV